MKIKKIIIYMMFFILIPAISFSHSGRTDSNGGHNSSSGYHYHHGYEAHSHINGYCPYEDDLSDWLSSTCPSCNSEIDSINGFCCFECGYDITEKYGVTMLSLVDGPASKTRSEYYEEVKELKEEIEKLKEKNQNLIDKYNNLEDEHSEEIQQLENDKSGVTSIWIFILIFCSSFFYVKGRNTKD